MGGSASCSVSNSFTHAHPQTICDAHVKTKTKHALGDAELLDLFGFFFPSAQFFVWRILSVRSKLVQLNTATVTKQPFEHRTRKYIFFSSPMMIDAVIQAD